MQHILETNSDYVSDGFYNAWRDNIGERSEKERKKYKVYEINAEEGTYNVVNCITCGYVSFIYSRYIS